MAMWILNRGSAISGLTRPSRPSGDCSMRMVRLYRAQSSPPEAALQLLHLTAPMTIPAGGTKVVRLLHDRSEALKSEVKATAKTIVSNQLAVKTTVAGISSLTMDKRQYLDTPIHAVIVADPSDTWSHGQTGYAATPDGKFAGNTSWHVIDNGPLMATSSQTQNFEHSSLIWETRLYRGENILRLRLRLNWAGLHQIVKLVIRAGVYGRTQNRRDSGRHVAARPEWGRVSHS